MNIQHASPVNAFTIHCVTDSFGLPDGQVSHSWLAYDAESGRPLWGTWSLFPDSCLAYTRERYPDAVYFASERGGLKGERL